MGIVSSEIQIDATPAVVYALVSDVTRTGDWSPECVNCRWLHGATAAEADARYRGASPAGRRPRLQRPACAPPSTADRASSMPVPRSVKRTVLSETLVEHMSTTQTCWPGNPFLTALEITAHMGERCAA